MKKTLVLGLLGLASTVATSQGQGFIFLDNYNTYGPYITYGAGSGGPVGTGISSAFTVGIYLGQGTLVAAADPLGTAIPTSLNAQLLLGTGPGSTTPAGAGGTPGAYLAGSTFQASAASGATITAMIVAYNGANYVDSTVRGHSATFQLVTKPGSDPQFVVTGSAQPQFSVFLAIPEPTTLALGGLGLVSMLVARRRK
jgi:hypothetical protein